MSKKTTLIYFFLIAALLPFVFFTSVCEAAVTATENITGHLLDKQFWTVGILRATTEIFVLTILFFFHQRFNWSLFCVAIGVVFLHFFFLWKHSVNIPITDDYKTILGFGNHFFSEESFSKKVELVTGYNNGNRMIFLRLTELAQNFFFGEINVKWLILFGNLFLIPLALFVSINEQGRLDEKFFLISVLLIFHLGFYDTMMWATTMNYIWVATFSALSFYFLFNTDRYSFLISTTFATLAVLSFGNGLLVFLINGFFLFKKKKWKKFSATIILLLMITVPYRDTSYSVLQEQFSLSLNNIDFVFCFLGSAFQFLYNPYFSSTLGIIIFFQFVAAVYKRYYEDNFTVFALWLFVILSAILTSFFRVGEGIETAISNRYGFFSAIGTLCCLIFLMENLHWKEERKKFIRLLVGVGIYHVSVFLFFYPEAVIRKHKLQQFMNHVLRNEVAEPLPPVIPENAETTIRESISKGFYKPEEAK